MKNKNHIYASIILAIILVITVLVIYFSSAKFIDTPQIILPSELVTQQQKIEYSNSKYLKDIVIDDSNYKDVIEKLERPLEYTMSILNEVHAFLETKAVITNVTVAENSIIADRDSSRFEIIDDIVYITRGDSTVEYSRLDFTDDEIIGIPSYENVLEINSDVSVLQSTINNEQSLIIQTSDGNINHFYAVSLVTGMLIKYEVYENGSLIRNVSITNLIIDK